MEIYEKIQFEYNRLILSSSQNYFHELDRLIAQGKVEIENAIDRLQKYSDKIAEFENSNIDIPQEIINEGYEIYNEVQMIHDDNERRVTLLSANIAINQNAIREISSLISKTNSLLEALINEEKKSMGYFEWRAKIPF